MSLAHEEPREMSNAGNYFKQLQHLYKSTDYFRNSINGNFHLACGDMNLELIGVFIELGVDYKECIKAFNAMCFANNATNAKKLLELFNITEESALLKLFNVACKVGDIDIMEWLSSEKNIHCYLQLCDPFVTACDHKQIDVAKWLLSKSARVYDDNGLVPAFIDAAAHDDSTMIDFIRNQNIRTEKSLDSAFRKAYVAKSKSNILKLIDWGVDVEKIKNIILTSSNDDFFHEITMRLLNNNNYMQMYNIISNIYGINRIISGKMILQSYAKPEDVPILFKWLAKESDWEKGWFLRDHSDCAKLILAKNHKFFIDAFLNEISSTNESEKNMLNDCGLTSLHQHVIYNPKKINYQLFVDQCPDDFVLYVLFKRNDIKSFSVLKKFHSNIQFEIDDNGNIVSYSMSP